MVYQQEEQEHAIQQGKLIIKFRNNFVDVCIADRTFSSIDDIVKYFKFGCALHYLYKSLWLKESDNTENFLKSNAYKILLCDPLDTIVKDTASLKTAIARKVIKRFNSFSFENINRNIKIAIDSQNHSVLNIVLSKNERIVLIYKLREICLKLIELSEDRKNSKKSQQSNPKKKLLLSPKEQKNKRNIKYINIKEESNPDLELHPEENRKKELQKISKHIKDAFLKLESAGDNILSLKTICNSKHKSEIFIDVIFF